MTIFSYASDGVMVIILDSRRINRHVNFLKKRKESISFRLLTKMKFFILSALFASTSAIELTQDTWDDSTAGKAVFVKFFAPWCGHCKKMKPAWDSLMKDFEGSESILVADVDCIEGGKSLCDKVGVKGFPTIKYGSPDDLQDYQGSRDHKELVKFAETLKPGCVVDTLENCSEEEEAIIAGLKEKTKENLNEIILAEAKEREQAHTDFKESVEKLQKEYEQLSSDRDSTLEDIKSRYNIGFVKQLVKLSESKTDL